MTRFLVLLLAAAVLAAATASAAPDDWAEGGTKGDDGATRDFYNRAASLPWANKLGDWRDAKDAPQGTAAYATATPRKGAAAEWDVTPLVKEWQAGTHPNQGFFLRVTQGSGNFEFASRENADAALRPQLVLTGEKGAATLAPAADTHLDGSSVRGHGAADVLRVSTRPTNALLRFDLAGAKDAGPVTKATLRLSCTGATSGSAATVGVYRCRQAFAPTDPAPVPGLAANYPGDKGIEKNPDVVFFTGFEADAWRDEWSGGTHPKNNEAVAADPARKFAPLQGKALSVFLPKGELTALNLLWKFKPKTGAEPEEMYFRYYVRLGDDWNQTVSGGKFPGFSGTYNRAGWGGRKANGENGWSARGHFGKTIPEGNPLAGRTPIGTYCYHTDQKGAYGDITVWTRGGGGYLENNRWYCVEQYVKLNTPGKPDGVFRAWVDGRLGFEKTDLRYRTVDTLKIEQVWMNIYHGGTVPSPSDQHAYIDNVVIARKYIGPMK